MHFCPSLVADEQALEVVQPGEGDMRRAELLEDALVVHALQHKGTCTGEHGIGIGKIRYLELEHPSAIAAMHSIKNALDGSHLTELWRMRASFYPQDVALLERFMVDWLKAGHLAAEGHRVVARYALEERLPLVSCPVLIIAPTADPHSYPMVPALHAAVPQAEVTEIEGGMVPLPDQLPESFAAAVEAFLDRVSAPRRRAN